MQDPLKTHGKFSWCELLTTDPEAAKKFYSELLGWTLKDMQMESLTYTVIGVGEEQVGGIMSIPPEAAGAPPHWGAYVTVDDVDAVAGKVATLGGRLIVEPRDIPGVGRFALIQDPQGATISVITYSAR